jgi:hypothetical protein
MFLEYDGSINLFDWTLQQAAKLRDERQDQRTKGLLIKSMAHEEWRASWMEADKKLFERKEYESRGNTPAARVGRRDLTPIEGVRFGKLIGIEILPPIFKQATMGKFVCDCGRKVEIVVAKARNGDTKSCGCGQTKDNAAKANIRWQRVKNENK